MQDLLINVDTTTMAHLQKKINMMRKRTHSEDNYRFLAVQRMNSLILSSPERSEWAY